MIPLVHDIDLYENDTDSLTIRWKNPDGSPVPNLNDAEIFLDVKKTYDGDILLSVMGEYDEESGDITFNFFEEDSFNLLQGTNLPKVTFMYDIEFVFGEAGGYDRTTLLRGRFIVYREVTRTR